MKFKNISEAKEYVVKVTSKVQSLEEIDSAIAHFKRNLDASVDDKSRKLWTDKIKELEAWKGSDDFKNGNYPQGIDELILEIVEWRAIINAFQNTETKVNPFEKSAFLAQWYVGAIYGIFTIIGKLVSRDRRDNSLRKLWEDISPIMLEDGACTKEEVEFIDKEMDRAQGRFTNANSQVLKYRNKLIAHNEASPIVEWDDGSFSMSAG